jgi:hypothetical protein
MFGKRCRKRLFVVVGAPEVAVGNFQFGARPLIARNFAVFLFWFSISVPASLASDGDFGFGAS